MEDHEKTGRFDLKTPFFSAAWSGKRMAELISLFSLSALIFLGFVLWEHKEDSKQAIDRYSAGMVVISQAIEQQAASQREFACLMAKRAEERQSAFTSGECRRYAEIGIVNRAQ